MRLKLSIVFPFYVSINLNCNSFSDPVKAWAVVDRFSYFNSELMSQKITDWI